MNTKSQNISYFEGEGLVRALLRALDWTASPLGQPANWPHELVTVVNLMLDSLFPASVARIEDGLFLYNDAFSTLLGDAPAFGFAALPGLGWPSLQRLIAEVYAQLAPAQREIAGPDGRLLKVACSPIIGSDGLPLGAFIVCLDVKTRSADENAARQDSPPQSLHAAASPDDIMAIAGRQLGQELLQTVFDALPVGIGMVSSNGTMLLSNQEMRRYLPTGIMPSRDDKRHDRWLFRNPDGSVLPRQDYPGARALRGERVVPGLEALYRQDDGTEIWTQVSAVPIRDSAGRILGQVGVVTDIDHIKRTENALLLSEDRYRKLFTQMDAGFCILQILFDESGRASDVRFLETNPRFESQTGLADVAGKTLRALVPDAGSDWIDIFAAVSRNGAPVRTEKFSSALQRWFDFNAFRVGEPDAGQVALVFRDTTERHKIEQDIRRLAAESSEASRRKSEFLAVLAHELRNPLAPIRTGLEVMRMRSDNQEMVGRVRDMLERQTRQMTHLIDDLLDIARVTSGKIEIRKQTVDLNQVVSDAIETATPQIQRAGHVLSVKLHPAPLLLHIDPTRVAQIAGNLLTNAAKYTPPGGRIEVSVGMQDADAIVKVTDNGLGIPEEFLTSVFDMFNQVGRNMGYAQGGLGIGLSLVQQLAVLHGGNVTAESEGAGKGSTFTLRLPAGGVPGSCRAGEAEPGHAEAHRRKFRILVVDDNRDAADSLALLLGIHGHEIAVVGNGVAALQTAKAFSPDIAFLDIGMPDMNGYELAERLRTVRGMDRLVLVAVTGWGAKEDLARARQSGFDRHFTKPLSAENLAELLNGLALGS